MKHFDRRLPLFVLLSAAAVLFAPACKRGGSSSSPAPTASASPDDPHQVVAEVDGRPITLAEVDSAAFRRVAQDRLFELRKQAIDELVQQHLLAKAAADRGVSPDQLLRSEVEGKVQRPSDAQVRLLFDQSGLAARGATLEQMRPQIEQSLMERSRSERRAVFYDDLKRQAKVRISLEEPRTAVAIPAEAPVLGPPNAKVTMIEFLDYNCPYCHRVQGIVDEVLARYPGQVRFVHRDFLLGNPRSLPAARAARCAGDQGRFWEYHRRLLTEAGDGSNADLARKASAVGIDAGAFSTCLASDRHDASIQQAVEQGNKAGVSGTPTFFINGRRLVGVRPVETFQEIIEEELKRAS